MNAPLDRIEARTGELPVVPGTTAPLSAAQEQMCFLQESSTDRATYSIPFAYRLRGNLDLVRLEASWHELVQRHDILRTRFVEVGGELRQEVVAVPGPHWGVVDLRASPGPQREERLRDPLRRMASEPFAPDRAPLWRLCAIQLGGVESVLGVTFHPAIVDKWGLRLLFDELAALYEVDADLARHQPPRASRYADYARWQRDELALPAAERHREFWGRQLIACTGDLALPFDRRPPEEPISRAGRFEAGCAPELRAATECLARQEACTPLMAGLAAFQVLLARLSGQEDIVVGTPMSLREREELQSLVGLMINLVPIRVRIEPGASFREVLRGVRDVVLASFGHGTLPFGEIMRAVRGGQRSPVHQFIRAAFVLLDEPWPVIRLPGLTTESVPVDPGTGSAKFELTLTLADRPGGGWDAVWEYSADSLDRSTVERFHSLFQTLLRSATETPDVPLTKLEWLTPEQRDQVVEGFNQTDFASDANCTLVDLMARQAERTPSAVAVELEERTMTFAELDQESTRLALRLRGLGVGPNVLVGLCFERSFHLLVGVVGILKAGGAYLPLDPGYPRERLAFMMADSGASVLVTETRLLPAVGAPAVRTVCLDAEGGEGGPAGAAPGVEIAPGHIAYVLYTSGSTGMPKAAMIPHGAICNHMLWMRDRFPVGPADAVLQEASSSFDASVWEFFLALTMGARLVLAPRDAHRDAGQLVRLVAHHRVSVVLFVPSLLEAFLDHPGAGDCRSLRRIFSGAEALSLQTSRRCLATLPAELVNLYGPTETTIAASYWVVDPADPALVAPLGRPVGNTRLYVLDSEARPLPIGVAGELYIGGAQVGVGYRNRPALTAEKFLPDPFDRMPGARMYRTGDRVRWRPDGILEFLGRLDNQVKIRGFRVELGEVEVVLRQHPALREAAVVARELAGGAKELVAHVVPAEGPELLIDSLRGFLGERLPSHFIPGAFVAWAALPLLPNGKLDRKALSAAGGRELTDARAYEAPVTETERLLAEIWAEVLGRGTIGRRDDFFALGGHSLLATKVLARIRAQLGVEIPIHAFFRSPTLVEFAKTLGVHRGSSHRPAARPLVALPRGGGPRRQ